MRKTANGTDVQIAICGSAGDGTIAAGDILRRAMALMGFKVIAFDLYPAEIRGFGKCISRVRVSTEQTYSLKRMSDVFVSLDDKHAIPHVGEVRDFGAVIYENKPIARVAEGQHISAHVRPAQIPYGVSIRRISEQAMGSARSRNLVVLGYIAGLYDLPSEPFHKIIAKKFATKSQAIIEANIKAFDAGREAAESAFRLDDVTIHLPETWEEAADAVMMTGNEAVVQGFLDAGIEAYFGYPITPATSIMEKLAREMPRQGGRLLQTEDEIAAVAATIGAGYAGARAATATSGPGLALMAEMLGLGAMAEVPAVVVVSQRAGPSTGMPTKTEQADLNAALYGSPGDSQRIVLAPTNVEGCYRCAGKAFEIAETYQTPVIVLMDLYLSNRYETVIPPKKNPFLPNAAKRPTARDKGGAYRRFAITPDYISPRAIPGDHDRMHTATGLEHNEFGRPTDQPDWHQKMNHKRHEKLKGILKIKDLTICKRFGDEGRVDVGLIGWGSTFGEILEAMFTVQEEGIRCAAMKVVLLSPLPKDQVLAFYEDCDVVLVPEMNYEGQFANLLAGAIERPVHRLTRSTGTPMEVEEIIAEIRRLAGKEKAA